MSSQRIAFVGTGGRTLAFVESVLTLHRQHNVIVALCDLSAKRMGYYNELIQTRWNHAAIPEYAANDFVQMLTEQKPDTVFVATEDSAHHLYINAALRADCRVITEKPMTIDGPRCRSIMDTASATGGKVRVAFNYRWGPYRTKVRELLAGGVIGRVKSVNLEYLLDTAHGADYFRRWHSCMNRSGGLLVHKSTHHFDLVNWWLDAVPASVFARGRLAYYGRENAIGRGDTAYTGYSRYTGQPAASQDPFRLDLRESESFRRLYLDAEEESGYIRDQNVFREGVDIYDDMGALVTYRTGETLTYSLIAYSPREGMRVTFNGDRGRLEYHEFTGSHMNRAVSGSEFKHEQHGSAEAEGEWIRVFPHFQPSYQVAMPPASGPHGGADVVLCEQLFSPAPPVDPWHRTAGHEQGAASILVGIAANQSILENRAVTIDEIVALPAQARKLSELI